MVQPVPENKLPLNALLSRRLLLFLKYEARAQGVSLNGLVESILKDYLKTKGVRFDEQSTETKNGEKR